MWDQLVEVLKAPEHLKKLEAGVRAKGASCVSIMGLGVARLRYRSMRSSSWATAVLQARA